MPDSSLRSSNARLIDALLRERRLLHWASRAAVTLAALSMASSWQPIALAQSADIPSLTSPLEVDEADPLLPNLIVDRPLSLQEQQALRASLEQLKRQGERQYEAGNIPDAFEIWIRELRLRRVLGIQEEVPALSRVGDIAWQENQTLEVRVIGDRLGEIEQEIRAQPAPDYGLLLQVAESYKTLRDRERAIAAYTTLIQQANQRGDAATEAMALAGLGEVHLAWFDYSPAAPVYEQLLALYQAQQNAIGEQQALEKLVIVYDETDQAGEAIAARQALIQRYRQAGDLTQVPALKIAVAERHRQLGQLNAAVQAYQEAIGVAQRLGYLGYAADAYRGLGYLYQSVDRPQDALTAYRFLLDVERQAYNTYGMMEAFDQMGQIHRSRGATGQAIASFQRGLALAQQLSYRTEYFNAQIQGLSAGQP
ncbi:MAG: hypothetical protein WBA10_10705 [Elainellaceae cyanobacterium]